MVLESSNYFLLLVNALCRISAVRKTVLLIDEIGWVTTQSDVRDRRVKGGLSPPVHRTTHI